MALCEREPGKLIFIKPDGISDRISCDITQEHPVKTRLSQSHLTAGLSFSEGDSDREPCRAEDQLLPGLLTFPHGHWTASDLNDLPKSESPTSPNTWSLLYKTSVEVRK